MSGARQDVARILVSRNALVPYPRQDDIGVVAEVCRSFVFDNGAYSAWKRGITLDVEGYTKWVEHWYRHPGFDWALIPDVIDGDEADNDAMLRDWPKHLARAVPVWHMHESLERLHRLCSAWPTVALGSSGVWATPGTPEWWLRMNTAMAAICDEHGRPPARLHGLRMLNPKIFGRLPLTSADSTNVAANTNGLRWDRAVYKPATPYQRACVLADRIENARSADSWTWVR